MKLADQYWDSSVSRVHALFSQSIKIQVVVFSVGTPCSDVVRHQSFGGPCCFHLQETFSLR